MTSQVLLLVKQNVTKISKEKDISKESSVELVKRNHEVTEKVVPMNLFLKPRVFRNY